MLLNFPEPRMEPFEEFQKIPTCPICGTPIDEIDEMFYDGDPHFVQRSDIIGCNKCQNIHRLTDYDEMYDILADE